MKKPGKINRINTELVIAIAALVISLFTVCIYVYQANIMAKQHKDSVWPHIYYGKSLNEIEGFNIKIMNKGIGPAIIKSLEIKSDDLSYQSWSELLAYHELDSLYRYCSSISGTVLLPGEEMAIFGIPNYIEGRKLWNTVGNLNIDIDYCSIHDDCWRTNGPDTFEIELPRKTSGLCR